MLFIKGFVWNPHASESDSSLPVDHGVSLEVKLFYNCRSLLAKISKSDGKRWPHLKYMKFMFYQEHYSQKARDNSL